MRFVNDLDLSFCLTVSTDIKRDDLLSILGKVEELPQQSFEDFSREAYLPGKRGLLNVFEDEGFLITLENSGYLGVTYRTVNKIAAIHGKSHYIAIYYSSGDNEHQYVEVRDGKIIANFDPLLDPVPDTLAEFFPMAAGGNTRVYMTTALIYRMKTMIWDDWLKLPTDTYVIDYRTDRH